MTSPVLQRWVVPAEDAEANRQLDFLDGVERGADALMLRAMALTTRVPSSLRQHWASPRIDAYQSASDLRVDVRAAKALAQPATRALDDIRTDVQDLGARLNAQRLQLTQFEAAYALREPAIQAQEQRRIPVENVLAEPEGAAKLAEWQNLGTAIQTMNDANIGIALAAFQQDLAGGLFTAADVAAARLLANHVPRKQAVVQWLADLFSSGAARLDTWGKVYPTGFDLRTGEFGGEWHIKSGQAPWLNGRWVFHAHCQSIMNEHGHNVGFRFKPILGTNHIKMTAERMAAEVQLDMPLTAQTLTQMAAPYQDQYMQRLEDSAFRATLKKGK